VSASIEVSKLFLQDASVRQRCQRTVRGTLTKVSSIAVSSSLQQFDEIMWVLCMMYDIEHYRTVPRSIQFSIKLYAKDSRGEQNTLGYTVPFKCSSLFAQFL